ncbi:MAG: S8 family serine peptidase [Verrucomicrobia bacterium]|nr:S8 family serine peptidase [Verrucomicrobiota bacterium]
MKRKFIVSKSILYKIKSGIKPEELQLALNEEEIVQFSSLNKIQVIQPRSSIDFSGEPGFINQWYINEHPSSIDWLDAMEIYSPKENVSVAVIDSGISFAHPDLANLENRGGMIAEINGINGFDDDGLGLIDDKHGWDFINWDNIAEDNDGHGTMVSGIIAAESSNGLGIVGIAPDSYIIPLKVVAGGTTDEQIKFAFDYAITAGAKIINFSAGFISYNTFEADIQEILFTLEKDYDILLILAADNGKNYGEPGFGYDTDLFPDYPVSYDGNVTLTVANSNQQLELHPSSSWGLNSVDLAAPGTDIFGLDIQQGTIPFFTESFNSYSNQWTSGSNSLTNYSPYIWGYYQDIYGVNWVTDSAYDAYGNNLYYTAYTDTFLSSPAFDLSLINAPFLSVNIFHDLPYNWLLGSYDLLIFEASIDNGISWIPIGLPRYGTTLYPGQKYTFPLYRFQGQSSVKIRFRLKSDGIYQGDGVYISDFSIFGKSPSFIYTGTEYQWNVGTSFATPIVSGVAAMLLSHRPELSTQDVRKIILQSVTKVDGLADKVASGGIVNAYEAIKLADAWEIETEAPLFYTLSSSVSPTGAGSVSGTGSYEEGSTASLSAESADGYVFSHWSGDASGSSNPVSVTINQDMSIVANFSATDNSNSWSSSSNIENNWKSFSWFGQFFEINSNWIYHLKLSWLYRHGDNLTSLWFYSSKHGWLFTSKNIFPYLFQHSKDSWIYLQDNQLYSWANQSWTAI